MAERATLYSEVIKKQGAPLDKCVTFIDGTVIRVTRPWGGLQRSVYSGHKRTQCIKFQALTSSDGLVFHFFGPVEGRRHDMILYLQSGVDAILRNTLIGNGQQHYINGDSAYILRA